MQITTENHGDLIEMRVVGRLDNDWSGHLNEAIDEAVRCGSHSIVLDLSGISYLSSAGIGALIRSHKTFQAIHGFFGIGITSPHVSEVIRMTGLAKMLLCDIEQIRRTKGAGRQTIESKHRVSAETGMVFEVYDVDPDSSLECEVVGDPTILQKRRYREEHCRQLDFGSQTFGLGLGALGRDFKDCAARFGEFLAVAGSAAQLPTSGNGKPDYQFSQGSFIPSVQVAYGLRCTGGFRHLYRFDSDDVDRKTSLASLVSECLTLSETDQAGIVLVAESNGLMGVSLRHSPVSTDETNSSIFTHPEIRKWMSYSAEGVFAHSVALVVGVASRGNSGPLAPLLRPLDPTSGVFGHFHAAVFSYRPFKKRTLDLRATVESLFDTEELHTVLHLLHDDREEAGQADSQFTRGACWVSPISNVIEGISP